MDSNILTKLRSGCVIPAHPLALRSDNNIDVRHQRALTLYYLDAGAGGLAVGVHTTQFAIHDPRIGLYHPVLELAIETAQESVRIGGCDEPIMIAGLVGDTKQAIKEAELAQELGYHLGLLSLTALKDQPITKLIEHCRNVAEVIPVMGFYLQQTISRMTLPVRFWQELVAIPNVLAIKIAPFNRYETLDVLEAVAYSGRAGDIALYTGNDDNIIIDILTQYDFYVEGRTVSLQIVGGLLGQWACWTKTAVEHLDQIKSIRNNQMAVPYEMLSLASQLTLANKAIFDAENDFAGCIPGISYVLNAQGLMEEIRTLDTEEHLSPGQAEAINRIRRSYPHLTDDKFVKENLHLWLED